MRIDDKNAPGIGSSNVGGVQGGQGVAGQERVSPGSSREAGGAGSPDRIQLSGLAAQLQALQPGSEAREAELARLKELVSSGNYQVDADKVSRALVNEALQEGPEAARNSGSSSGPLSGPPAAAED